ncbi:MULTISPECIES: phosphomethylpyrimidine synthase ThiC [unclassified Anaerobiospirillum]|uniref:phosphomethylpyrimidine synthase ThiC n=1 Tax=unclassified Anaerobiospirillum TaxID=2647410 RepID=UPI001FF1CBF9|nr:MULTISPECIES: phosphomethylpyrimidine synthase ThiC [unclassified Anaerobiospirillum]MCK0535873.1 phosphomethylpyrimidine synthase ThiC [Anaerobiospirillum sp. NML120511]MCK0541064.1 phosphomethylpyrimidine synthase ThiC [Anaerobiospirillum sp. NML02-A-032]
MLRFPQFSKCSASSEDQTGAAGGETLNISRIHFDDLAAAKAAHLNAKLKGQTVEGVATPKKALKRPELRKVMVEFADGSSEVKVPYAQLSLSNGDTITRYIVDFDTDSTAERAKAREAWIAARGSEPKTQLEYARAGIITPEMEYVALRESACFLEQITDPAEFGNKFHTTEGVEFGDGVIRLKRENMLVTPEMVRDEIAAGRAVIPANHNHPESEPMIIGKRFLTKVNSNIGASAVSSGHDEEIGKLKTSLRYGADTVMDLSTGLADLMGLRSAILRASPVPIGTVPVYEALDRAGGDANALSWEVFRGVIEDQAKQGVDYFTIHAGLTKDLLPHAANRVMGIVSRGGAIMASHMMQHDCENMAWEHFDELMEICRRYDVSLSLGDGLRPGGIYDACDEAQYGELRNIGKLALRCYEHGVQCFIEGPGHVPLHLVEENQKLEDEHCHEAPFYTLGPLVTDVGAGFDHITSAIGATTIGMHGTAMLCYVTPSEHLALPTPDDVRVGLITYKIAAHSADLAKGIKQAYNMDHAMSRARVSFRWLDQFALSFDEQHAYDVWRAQMDEDECHTHEAAFCSMCGPRFCPMRLNRRLQARYGSI